MGEPRIATLTIANGQTTSNAILLQDVAAVRRFVAFVYTPATMPETVTVQVSPTIDQNDFIPLQSNGVDITLPAGKATPLTSIVASRLRLVAGSAVGADRVVTWRAVAVDSSAY